VPLLRPSSTFNRLEILLCTIGFAGKTAEEFFRLLQEARVEKLIDVRLNRGGQLSGYAKHPDLEYFLQKVAHTAYSHEPRLAPTSELLDIYRDTKDWAAYETGFLALMQTRGVPQAFDASGWPPRAIFQPGRVPGEFGGLFGDGASAFLLRAQNGSTPQRDYTLGEFFFGCAGQYAGAIRVADAPGGKPNVHFDGEALSRAAITRLEKVIRDVELRSGFARSSAQGWQRTSPILVS
jgi:hypothetical protein